MKHVSILVPLGHTSLPNIDGAHQILSHVNMFMEQIGKEPLFVIQLVGISNEINQRGVYTIRPDVLLEDVKNTDLIIVPAMHGDIASALELNAELVPWIIKQRKTGAELASFCVGRIFTGFNRVITWQKLRTHWVMANEFRKMFPEVNLVDDKIMTEDDGIYTSGGAYSYLNLLVYLIEKYAGREVAIFIAKAYMIDIDRNSQSPFIIFKGQKEHEDEPIKKAQEFIENNFDDKITVDQLSSMFSIGRRTLERRFKKATSNTVSEYIQRVKIEVAKKNFETSTKNINEVMYDVGYIDNKAFRLTFKKITGLSPIDYRNKYNKGVGQLIFNPLLQYP